jgi:hypothetical protein
MIHYTCDSCKREIDLEGLRYSVKIEVNATLDPIAEDEADDDRDHLLEVQEILEQLETSDGVGDDVHLEARYDLCPDCCRKFRLNPLGRESIKQFDFSKN